MSNEEQERTVILRIFQDVVVVAHDSQENGVFDDFKGQAIKVIDPCLPNIFFSFYLFRMQGGMVEIVG